MMRIKFVSTGLDDWPTRPTWWASHEGFEKAFGVCYSPAFGEKAMVLFHRPFSIPDEHRFTFAEAVLRQSTDREFLFTPDGFEIEIPNAVLDLLSIQGET